MATYSGQVVKWDEAVAKGTSEFPATLAWDAKAPVEPDENGNYPIPDARASTRPFEPGRIAGVAGGPLWCGLPTAPLSRPQVSTPSLGAW